MVSFVKGMVSKVDPRFFKRPSDLKNIEDLESTVNARGSEIPQVSIEDLEGRPFLITQSDRSAARGELVDVNGVKLSEPVNLWGGADYMLDDNGDVVWASAANVISGLQQRASRIKKETGQDPLLLPSAMAPTGIDFATMPLETMFKYAAANMGAKDKLKLNRKIKEIYPTFRGVEDPRAIEDVSDFGQGDIRKKLLNELDKFRSDGGLSTPEARLVTSDVSQLSVPDTRIKNVGVFDTSGGTTPSAHPTYGFNAAGRGLGAFKEEVNAFDLIPEQSAARYGERVVVPEARHKRALALNYGLQEGIITDKIIKSILAGSGVAGANASEDSSAVDDLQASIDFADYEREQNTLPNKIKNYFNSAADGNFAVYDEARDRGEDTIEANRSQGAANIGAFINEYTPDIPILGQFLGTGIGDALQNRGYNKTKGNAAAAGAFAGLDFLDIGGAAVLAKNAVKNVSKQAVVRGGQTMYHGTSAGKEFDRIDPSKLQGRDAGFLGKGFYTGDSIVASGYAKNMKGGNVQPIETAAGRYKNYTLEDKQNLGMAVNKNPNLSELLTQQNTLDGYIGARVLDGKGGVVEQVNYFPTRDVENAIKPFTF
tara:strand:+ start:2199 stop:3992 length:1794 start_codon:yes stop_codon:yes gene_type:complete